MAGMFYRSARVGNADHPVFLGLPTFPAPLPPPHPSECHSGDVCAYLLFTLPLPASLDTRQTDAVLPDPFLLAHCYFWGRPERLAGNGESQTVPLKLPPVCRCLRSTSAKSMMVYKCQVITLPWLTN